MSYTALSLIPIFQLVEFYSATQNKIRNHSSKDSSFFDNINGKNIRKIMDSFLMKHQIRSDIEIHESDVQIGGSVGANLLSGAGILVRSGFFKKDENACIFVLKHEIAHIKNNDSLRQPLILVIIATVAVIFTGAKMNSVMAYLASIAIVILGKLLLRNYCEFQADSFAIANCSIAELKGGLRFLHAIRELKLGLDLYHPPISTRIQCIESALQSQGICLRKGDERVKIDKIINLFLKN